MALGPAKSSTAFPRAGKELDIQIHFSEQLIDPFFTTPVLHSHPWHGLVPCLQSSKKPA